MDNEPRMNLDDDEMSLQSKIAGGGRDIGAQSSTEEVRLCPACGRVTTFVQGKCTNCEYKPGMSAGIEQAAAVREFESSGGGAAGKVLLVILLIVVLGVGGYFIFKAMGKSDTDQPAPTGTSAAQPEPAATTPVVTPESHAGGLSAVTIDETFNNDLSAAIEKGNTAWKAAGIDCYVYRYRISETTVPATSQTVSISLFCGGKDVARGVVAPDNEPLMGAIKPFMDGLGAHAGVSASASLENTGGDEAPDANDVYLRYGYYYGQENMAKIGKLIEGLETIKQSDGSYPDLLQNNVGGTPYKTKGSLGFEAGGFGYLPIYKTDSSGNIIMGQGSGLASFKPEAITGYYLVAFLEDKTKGIDMFSADDYAYYEKNILPFPYAPEGPVKNMSFHPDGAPDGIACIVKNGELQH